MTTMLNLLPATAAIRGAVIVSGCLLLLCCRSATGQELDYQGELTFPGIVRFSDLPRRMYLEPELSLPEPKRYLEDSMVTFLERILGSAPDDEILIEAIRSLQRVQVEKLADVGHIEPQLRKYLAENNNSLVQQVCVSALAAIGNVESAAAVAEYCVPRNESLCLEVEPEFVRWGGDALQATWRDRINRPGAFSSPLVQLACSGLADLEDSSALQALKSLVDNDPVGFSVRHAAARAVGRIDPSQAADLAQKFQGLTVVDRLVACALLEHAQSEIAYQLLVKLCNDKSNAVASCGWQILAELKPQLLVDKLDRGAVHPEANVRLAAVDVLSQLPTTAGCELLQEIAADSHIGVRNAARNALRQLASTDADLKKAILKNAGTSICSEKSNWQQLEQSLVLLGELRHREWQSEWIRLLEHPRPEVYVTASWLLHVMPDTESADVIDALTIARYAAIETASEMLQLTFLFQHAGFVQAMSLEPLCSKQFTKGGDPEMRGAGLWAIGRIYADQPRADLVGKLLERIFDDDMFAPEDFLVRRMSVLALASMNARSTVSELKRARQKYTEFTLLGEAVRWALPKLGGEALPTLEVPPMAIRNFPVSPL